MVIRDVNFLKSSMKVEQLPAPEKPEFAFIGRSNVGKSSLINRLCNRKNLARTSAQPGKTQAINHFIVDDAWYLVDLPGYGYAKVSKADRKTFRDMIFTYLKSRKTLACAFLLVDSRIPPQKSDLDMVHFMGEHGIPFCIVLTKIDGETQNERAKNFALLKKELMKEWEELPTIIQTSAEKGKGMEELLAVIENAMQAFSV